MITRRNNEGAIMHTKFNRPGLAVAATGLTAFAPTSTRAPRTGDDTDHSWHRDSSVVRDETEICVGSRHLSATGRVWTVRRFLSRSDRYLLGSSSADGEVSAVMDRTALLRMINLDHTT
jgi:hypothetical protein